MKTPRCKPLLALVTTTVVLVLPAEAQTNDTAEPQSAVATISARDIGVNRSDAGA